MNIDKRTLDMLLTLSDDKLATVIKKLAADSGVDVSNFNISQADLAAIRATLSMATDSDIARATELIQNYKTTKKENLR